MCGIVGSFHPQVGRSCSLPVLEAMRDRMIHRGPDGAGSYRSPDGRCALGHRRLSIIDLSKAAGQPMGNADGTVWIVFNGEIYNHADLRQTLTASGRYRWVTHHSDTEVVLHAFEEWGVECVGRLNGMFALAIYDARIPDRPVLHLIRDRVGKKPLYLTRTNQGEWLFASEIRALLAHPQVSPEMDRVAFWHYLTFIVAPAPLTLFRGIFKLPAAHVVTIDHQGRAAARRYWSCRPDQVEPIRASDLSFDEAAAELTRHLRAAVARRMVSDVPFGVLLSGGVDSSLNVALMSELMDRPVRTFTIGYDTHEEFNEFHHARRIAERYRTDHHETRIDSREALAVLPHLVELQDEPIADNVCIPLYFLSRLVRESGTTVVQIGEGADEHFLGYWWCEHYRRKQLEVYDPARRSAAAPRSWWRSWFGKATAAVGGLSEDDEIRARATAGQELFWGGAVCWWGSLRQRLTPDVAPYGGAAIDCPIEGLLPEAHRALDSHGVVRHHLAPLDGWGPSPEVLERIPYLESCLRLPEHLLMRVDKMTMAHSVEARAPFLDPEIIEFAARLPASYKLADGIGKRILKRAAEPYIDHDLLYRRKQGFGAPMDQWFREGDFGRHCLAAFEASPIAREGLVDREYVVDLLKGQSEGRSNYGFHLWTIMNAVFWHERWIGGGARAAA